MARNAVASAALQRMRLKMETGRRGDEAELAEQVRHLVHQAGSQDKLCVMFEGWTSWI